jgi:hypothetical protein
MLIMPIILKMSCDKFILTSFLSLCNLYIIFAWKVVG